MWVSSSTMTSLTHLIYKVRVTIFQLIIHSQIKKSLRDLLVFCRSEVKVTGAVTVERWCMMIILSVIQMQQRIITDHFNSAVLWYCTTTMAVTCISARCHRQRLPPSVNNRQTDIHTAPEQMYSCNTSSTTCSTNSAQHLWHCVTDGISCSKKQ